MVRTYRSPLEYFVLRRIGSPDVPDSEVYASMTEPASLVK
jgi:hypothetical protein